MFCCTLQGGEDNNDNVVREDDCACLGGKNVLCVHML